MTRTGERAVKSRLRTPTWIARIEAPDGEVLGAGVLLAPDRVLTAGHVVTPGARYAVRLVGVPGQGAVTATVRPDEHVPEREDAFGDRSGDLALLRLAEPLPAEHTTRLYRLASPHGPVSMYGFPAGDDGGRWHGATLVAARGRDSRVQLRPLTPGELAAPGFSGGGVVDHATDQVIGIVLSVDEGQVSAFSQMSPTETILSHLPQAAAWTDGASAVDPRLRSRAANGAGRLDLPFATELAGWFRGEGWPVLVTVVPARGDRAFTLERAVTLADRELRTQRNTSAFSHDPPETVPPAGAHDLALDVRQLTDGQVMDRIAERLGIRDDPRPERLTTLRVPLAAVLVGVEQSAEPDALLALLDRLARHGARLLLVHRRQGGRAAQAAESLVHRPLRERWTRLGSQLDRIIDELGPALDARRDRVTAGPGAEPLLDQAEAAVGRSLMLRAWIAHSSEQDREPRRADLLFTFEDAAERRGQRLEAALDLLDARLRRWAELRGRVTAQWPLCRRRAEEQGDRVLEAYRLYEAALILLRQTPCDIERAEAAADRFLGFCAEAAGPGEPAGPREPAGEEGGAEPGGAVDSGENDWGSGGERPGDRGSGDEPPARPPEPPAPPPEHARAPDHPPPPRRSATDPREERGS
ncbi:S1 family peptidase [Streptomyces murinus]|uniref:S1 family peptidase n=1 Tax=Streptomyces murinus TaxID=33900 RepID=UPI002114709A|nr:serine protease [Streptomyces murinus]